MISTATRATQRAKILDLLVEARSGWVSLFAIRERASQYNARIFELRRLGFRIENKIGDLDGVRMSWFRLLARPSADHAPQQIDSASPTTKSFPEFGTLAPERYGVD